MEVVVPSMSRRMALRGTPPIPSVSGTLLQRPLGGDVGRPEAERLELRLLAGLRVVRRPARGVLEQADGPDGLVRAEVEPVVGAARHADHVALDHLEAENRPLVRVDVEEAAAVDDE